MSERQLRGSEAPSGFGSDGEDKDEADGEGKEKADCECFSCSVSSRFRSSSLTSLFDLLQTATTTKVGWQWLKSRMTATTRSVQLPAPRAVDVD